MQKLYVKDSLTQTEMDLIESGIGLWHKIPIQKNGHAGAFLLLHGRSFISRLKMATQSACFAKA